VLQCVAVYCSALQRVAVCCSVLQCVAVCCSVTVRTGVYTTTVITLHYSVQNKKHTHTYTAFGRGDANFRERTNYAK